MNSSHNQDTSATRGGASSVATPANTVSGIFTGPPKERKLSHSSAQGAPMFNNLHNVKRGSMDEADKARRQSLSDQTKKPGIIGQMWNNFTKGE